MVGVLVIDMRKRSYPPIWSEHQNNRIGTRKLLDFSHSSFSCGRGPATSGRFRRKWAPISPWALDFCAVFGGSCSLSASPTWGNADAGWRFGPILPAKPPRSCKWGSLALKVAHEAVQLRCRRGDVEHTGASAECGDRNTLAE